MATPRSTAVDSSNTKIIYTLAFAGLIYGFLASHAGWTELRAVLVNFPWWRLPLALLLVLIGSLLTFLKWRYYWRLHGLKISDRDSWLIHLAGLASPIIHLKSAELAPPSPIAGAHATSDIMAHLALIALASGGVAYGHRVFWISSVAFLMLFLAMGHRRTGELLIMLKTSGRMWRPYAARYREAFKSFQHLRVGYPRLFWTVLLSVASLGCEGAAFYLILQGLNVEVSWLGSVFIFTFSSFLGKILFLPGGLGVVEISLVALLRMVAVPVVVAVAAAFIVRLVTLWFPVLIGWWVRGQSGRVTSSDVVGQP